jgi:hypothetical protein
MKATVFIHTNERQWLGALVAAHALRRNSAHAKPRADGETFDIRILEARDFPFLAEREGQSFLRGGVQRVWKMDDLQSFTPLRFLPPKLMGFEGRAVVIDPDIFAVADVWELLSRDMQGKAVLGRRRSARPEKDSIATSAMLFDCAKLRDWDAEREFAELFEGRRDYKDWIALHHVPAQKKGFFEPEWNDFDRLTSETKMLHNTKRRTQPWKTGLPVDFIPADKLKKVPVLGALDRLRVRVFGPYAFLGRYAPHPDPRQEALFFGLLRECLESGSVSEELVREEIARSHVRRDALELAARAGPPPYPRTSVDEESTKAPTPARAPNTPFAPRLGGQAQ